MRPAGRVLLIVDLIGRTYFTCVIFTFIWNLKVMFYYLCHLPRLDKTLNFEHSTYIFCLWSSDLPETSYLIGIIDMVCGNKMPTRCSRWFLYCRSYCLLNMFRAPLCPSSGAQEYYTGCCCLWYLVLELWVVCPVCGMLQHNGARNMLSKQ